MFYEKQRSEVALARKSDPVCKARNTTDKSAEVSSLSSELSERWGNSAHMWMLNKLVEVGGA